MLRVEVTRKKKLKKTGNLMFPGEIYRNFIALQTFRGDISRNLIFLKYIINPRICEISALTSVIPESLIRYETFVLSCFLGG